MPATYSGMESIKWKENIFSRASFYSQKVQTIIEIKCTLGVSKSIGTILGLNIKMILMKIWIVSFRTYINEIANYR